MIITQHRRSRLARCAAAALAVALAGCVYRPDIQQGNYFDRKSVDQVQVGMTRTQVRYLLGTPMLPDVFDKDRWDYLYYFVHGRVRRPVQQHLVAVSYTHLTLPTIYSV